MALSESAAGGLFRGPPAYVPRTPWSPVRAVLAGLAILMLSVLCMLGALAAPSRWGPSILWRQDANELASLGIWQAATVILTLAASAMFGGKPRDVLSLGAPAGGPATYVKGLLMLTALQVVVSAIQLTFYQHDMYADLRPFVKLFGENWSLALLVVGVGAPLSEELLFRGFLLSALAQSRLGFWGGALVTTSLWTALHAGYSAAGVVEVFLIGILFSWLVWRTGSLRVAILCHALYNSIIVLVLRSVPLPV
jgi:membrane protease YdiL (CAAX protease family)